MKNYVGYKCSICNAEFSPVSILYTCPRCGGNLDVILDYTDIKKKYHIEDITSRREQSLWRYTPLLPVSDPGGEGTPLHAAGWTPVTALNDLL